MERKESESTIRRAEFSIASVLDFAFHVYEQVMDVKKTKM